jgi:hypothetical protein
MLLLFAELNKRENNDKNYICETFLKILKRKLVLTNCSPTNSSNLCVDIEYLLLSVWCIRPEQR